jgi:valyl-tRNA synthetase
LQRIPLFGIKVVFLHFEKRKAMCQTQVISRHIGRIGRRSFDRRMRIVSPLYVERRGEITRLLNEVDALSELLHEEFPTITEEDYKLFGPELKIVIGTLKSLLKESLTRHDLKSYNERMREQIVDLEELDHDIREFRVEAPKDEALQRTLASISELDFSKYAG